MKETIKGPRSGNRLIKIELDSDQIFPNDPGQGTPALVVLTDGIRNRVMATGTFNCAVCEREVDGTVLSDDHAFWLNTQIDKVDDFVTKHTREKKA